jgi:hypothetical protein
VLRAPEVNPIELGGGGPRSPVDLKPPAALERLSLLLHETNVWV